MREREKQTENSSEGEMEEGGAEGEREEKDNQAMYMCARHYLTVTARWIGGSCVSLSKGLVGLWCQNAHTLSVHGSMSL